jgi:hypothetical protein
MTRLLSIIALTVIVSSELPAATAPDLTLNVANGRVSVTGVTAGGEVVLVTVSRERQPYVKRLIRRDYYISDGDNDGAVSVDGVVAEDAVWCAVDLATGRYATTAAPGRFPLKPMVLPQQAVTRDGSGNPRRIDAGRGLLEALLVRPHVGAWTATAGDGGASDADGQVDGRVSIDTSRMQPLGQSPPAPQVVTPGDTVVLIDPLDMEVFVSAVRP